MISGSAIAPIQPNGSKRPLFAIHVLGRGLNFYRPLAKHLVSDQPVYGLAAQVIDQPDALPNEVKALATHYIQQMQTVQPQGPYQLDTFAPSTVVKKLPLHSRFVAYCDQLFKMTLTQALEKFKEEWLERTLKYSALAEVYQWGYRTCDRPFPEALQDILYARQNLDASSVYVPQVYPGRIVFLRAKDQQVSIKFGSDPRSGWGEVAAGGVEVHEIPGNHTSMLQEPNVRVLAKAFQLYLD